MKVSVIIPSYRRRSCLLNVLDSLARQTCQPDEVFVVDASPENERLGRGEIDRYPRWLRYLEQEEPGNISRQRNEALQQCRGDVILFLDDDVEFSEHLIQDHLDALTETNADGISGMVLLPGEEPRPEGAPNTWGLLYDPGSLNYLACDHVVDTHVICTANFSVYRIALMSAGGFDEQILGTLDDVDLGVRMARTGYRLVHHPGPRVLHLKLLASGSRVPELGMEWRLTNLFYFQFRHFPQRRPQWLLLTTLWDYCRPSRKWLTPTLIWRQSRVIVRAYRAGFRRLAAGPMLLQSRERQLL